MKKLLGVISIIVTLLIVGGGSVEVQASVRPESARPSLEDICEQVKVVEGAASVFPEMVSTLQDNDVTTFLAFAPCETDSTVVLALGAERKVHQICFYWTEEDFSPAKFIVYDVDYRGRNFKKLAQVSEKAAEHVITLPEQPAVAFLKVVIPGRASEARLAKLEIWAEPFTDFEKIVNDNSEAAGQIILDAKDPANGLSVFRKPVRKKMATIAEFILDGKENLTPHEKIVELMKFINTFRVGIGSDGDPETTIREKIGACGGYTNVLLALAATQGIPGHIISMGNYPQNTGHAVAELYINGKWSVYDPTYAAYYTTTPGNTTNPNVLSFEELRSGMGQKPDVQVVVYNRERLEQGQPYSYMYLGPEIYTRANPAGIIGPNRPFTYPLYLDLGEKPAISEEVFGPLNQGASHLGAAGICNEHSWHLTGLTPGHRYRFIVEPNWLGGEMVAQRDCFLARAKIRSGGIMVKGAQGCFYKSKLEPWVIELVALDNKVELLLEHSYRGPDFFYVSMKKYSLQEVHE